MSCEICGVSEDLQIHHILYEPKKTIVVCIGCHNKIHKQHGVGNPKGTRSKLHENEKQFIKLWKDGISRLELMKVFNISFATVTHWRKKLNLKPRPIASRARFSKDGTCPYCSSDHVVKAGLAITSLSGPRQRLKCQECGHTFYPPEKEEPEE